MIFFNNKHVIFTILSNLCGETCKRSIGFEINETYVKIGLRRLNIKSNFNFKELEKVKKRKTKNKSKIDHNQTEKLI